MTSEWVLSRVTSAEPSVTRAPPTTTGAGDGDLHHPQTNQGPGQRELPVPRGAQDSGGGGGDGGSLRRRYAGPRARASLRAPTRVGHAAGAAPSPAVLDRVYGSPSPTQTSRTRDSRRARAACRATLEGTRWDAPGPGARDGVGRRPRGFAPYHDRALLLDDGAHDQGGRLCEGPRLRQLRSHGGEAHDGADECEAAARSAVFVLPGTRPHHGEGQGTYGGALDGSGMCLSSLPRQSLQQYGAGGHSSRTIYVIAVDMMVHGQWLDALATLRALDCDFREQDGYQLRGEDASLRRQTDDPHEVALLRQRHWGKASIWARSRA